MEFQIRPKRILFSKHVIYWSPNVVLKQSDFQDPSNLDTQDNVHYYYGLYLKANSIEKAFVRSYFDKNKSGIKDTLASGLETEMEIQQLLFDLNEAYSRKFNNEIDKINFNEKTKYIDLERVGEKIFSELHAHTDLIFQTEKTDSELLVIWRPKIDSLLTSFE